MTYTTAESLALRLAPPPDRPFRPDPETVEMAEAILELDADAASYPVIRRRNCPHANYEGTIKWLHDQYDGTIKWLHDQAVAIGIRRSPWVVVGYVIYAPMDRDGIRPTSWQIIAVQMPGWTAYDMHVHGQLPHGLRLDAETLAEAERIRASVR